MLKPDYLDLDKDGNKTEPMKEAVKDREPKYTGGGAGASKKRMSYQEGGSLLSDDMPKDMDDQMLMVMTPPMESEMKDDDDMEKDYTRFIMDEALSEEEEDMLVSKLEQDKELQMLFDKVINDEYVKCASADKFALESDYEASAWLWQDSEQFTINDVHVDYDKFDITFGLYLPRDDSLKEYGTQFWKPDEIPTNLDVSLIRENCTLIDQVPFIANTMYFMPRTKHSWHSSPIIDKPMRRNHVYGYYKTI